MRQLIYMSASTAGPGRADLDGILAQSRHNNAIDGITGLLWYDDTRFLQVLEGPWVSVEDAMARIRTDPRHDEVAVLLDREIAAREFGGWSMVRRAHDARADLYDTRLHALLADTPRAVRDRTAGLVAA